MSLNDLRSNNGLRPPQMEVIIGAGVKVLNNKELGIKYDEALGGGDSNKD